MRPHESSPPCFFFSSLCFLVLQVTRNKKISLSSKQIHDHSSLGRDAASCRRERGHLVSLCPRQRGGQCGHRPAATIITNTHPPSTPSKRAILSLTICSLTFHLAGLGPPRPTAWPMDPLIPCSTLSHDTSLDASASLFLVVVKASLAVGQRSESQRNLKAEILPPASFPSTSNLHKPSEDPWNDYHKATAVDATPARVAKHPTFGVRSPVVSVVKDSVEGRELPSPLQPFSRSEASRLLEQTSCSLRRPGGSKRCTAENRFDSEGVTE